MLACFLYPSFTSPIGSLYFLGRSFYTYAYVTHGSSYYVREIGAALLFCAYAWSIALVLGYPTQVILMPLLRGQIQKIVRFFRS